MGEAIISDETVCSSVPQSPVDVDGILGRSLPMLGPCGVERTDSEISPS